MKRIVVVEDNPDAGELFRLILEEEGFAIDVVDQPSRLESVLQTIPDLFILDLGLPGEDGIALCRRLRADPRTRTTPILVVSAYAISSIIVEAYDAGANDFVRKPFESDELVRRARRLAGSPEPNVVAERSALGDPH